MGFNILQWNVNSLVAHENELKQLLARDRNVYHVLSIQETFLKQSSRFKIPGYNSVRRETSGTHGVV